MHCKSIKFIFCKCLVQGWDFMDVVSYHQKQLLFLLFLFSFWSNFLLTDQPGWGTYLRDMWTVIIFAKYVFSWISFLMSLFQDSVSPAVELRICASLDTSKWLFNVILGLCYPTTLLRKEGSVLERCFPLLSLKVGGLLISMCLNYNFVPFLFLGNGCPLLKFCHYNNSSPLQDSAKVSCA